MPLASLKLLLIPLAAFAFLLLLLLLGALAAGIATGVLLVLSRLARLVSGRGRR